MKKIFAFLLTLSLLMIAGVVFAEANQQSGLYTYVINDDHTATITGYNWEGWFIKKEEEKTFTSMLGGKTTEIVTVSYPGTDIEVPSELDGYPVTTIAAEAFRYPDNWERVKGSERVALNLPDTLVSIGEYAFWNAPIKTIHISQNLQFVGSGAFVTMQKTGDDRSWTTTFVLRKEHPYLAVIDNALYNKAEKMLLVFGGNDTNVLTIPEGILAIGNEAFFGEHTKNKIETSKEILAEDVLHVYLPTTLTHIGDYAFESSACVVHNIDQTQLTSIGDCAFMNACVAFNPKEETKIPGSVGETRYCSFPITLEKIGAYCFANIRRVEILARTTSASTSALGSFTRKYYFDDYIIIPSKAPITEIPSYAFYQSDLHFDIQAPITTIGDYAFSEIFQHSSPFTDYRRMNVSYLKNIGESTCWGKFLTSLDKLPAGVTTIPYGYKWKGEEIPDNITMIESATFGKVTDFKLWPGLVEIAVDAFEKGSTFIVEEGTYSEAWVQQNGFEYIYEGSNSLDWLN